MTEHVPIYDLYGEKPDKRPDFWLHCETIASRSSLHRWEIALHRHEGFFQILYIQAGSGEAIFEGRVHAIHPPAVITIPPQVDHGFRFSRDIAGLVITVVATHLRIRPGTHSGLGEWLSAPCLTSLDKDDDDAIYLGRTLERIGEEFASRHSGGNDLIDACLTSALVLTARFSTGGRDEFLGRSDDLRFWDSKIPANQIQH
ncbi:hypothetical protein C5748_04100 [Phyllobacterium phragmitis]|uniref:AraC-type arabinose-binding/dimerisation domain-containing protein n=1 Tax=Phyllobacterium phragmitis TaxID=2670329 RepID=A0A2S9IVP2_9HYPH|nr:hypothetical protein C5748_04100 [Phyllobacterium phragmitis]